MAQVRFGGGITAMSGSIAGNTFARNRFGFYVRARTKPVNPKSTGQSVMRAILAFLSEAWHDVLTPTQRTAWETYATAVTMKNRLGESINVTGFNMFIRTNSVVLQHTNAMIAPGPTSLSMYPSDAAFTISASAATQLLTINFTVFPTMSWCDHPNAFMELYMGRPQVVTRNFFNGPYRHTGAIPGSHVPVLTSPKTVPATFTLIQGQRIWVAARILEDDGRLSIRFQDDCVVGA
jgi:hypothetical protein